MAETATLARPYANAAFDLARSADALGAWSRMLRLLAAAADAGEVRALIASPTDATEVKAHRLIDIVREEIDDRCRRFVHILAENKRLDLLAEISGQFEARKAEAERTLDVEIAAAVDLSPDQVDTYTAGLARRFGRDVNVSVRVEPGLVGGAVIRAGDTVIDGSVRGRLTRLMESLRAG